MACALHPELLPARRLKGPLAEREPKSLQALEPDLVAAWKPERLSAEREPESLMALEPDLMVDGESNR